MCLFTADFVVLWSLMLILFTSYPICTWKILSKMLFILTPLITIDMFLHWQSHVVVTRSKIITIPQNFNYLNKYKRPVLMMSIMIKRMVFLVILVGVRNVYISLLLILLYLRLISKLLYIIKISEYWTEGAIKNG